MIIQLGDDQASLFALIEDDLLDTIRAKSKEKGITAKQLAKALGLCRTYFYTFFTDRRIRLEYLIQLQNILSLELVDQADIDGGIMMINDAAEERYVLQ